MFYLIGGAPRTGKTTLAKNLSKESGVPWISTDTLESIVSTYVSKTDFPHLFPKAIIRKETGGSNDSMYSEYSSQEIVNAYLSQSKAVWKAIEMFLAVEDKQDHSYILEGYHIHPELIKRFELSFPTKTRAVFLGRSHVPTIVKSATENAPPGDWFTGKTSSNETYPKIAAMLALFSAHIEAQANECGLAYFNVDDDFQGTLNRAQRACLGLS